MKKQPSQPTHGGKRANAGKKPLPADKKKDTKCLTFDQAALRYLATFTGKDGIPSASSVVNQLVLDSDGFKAFQKKSAKKK